MGCCYSYLASKGVEVLMDTVGAMAFLEDQVPAKHQVLRWGWCWTGPAFAPLEGLCPGWMSTAPWPGLPTRIGGSTEPSVRQEGTATWWPQPQFRGSCSKRKVPTTGGNPTAVRAHKERGIVDSRRFEQGLSREGCPGRGLTIEKVRERIGRLKEQARGGSTLHHRGPHRRERPQGDGPDLEAPWAPGLDHAIENLIQSGRWNVDYRWTSFGEPTPTGKYLEILPPRNREGVRKIIV